MKIIDVIVTAPEPQTFNSYRFQSLVTVVEEGEQFAERGFANTPVEAINDALNTHMNIRRKQLMLSVGVDYKVKF